MIINHILTYRFNMIPIKIPVDFIVQTGDSKIHVDKGLSIAKTMKKN